jgi:hypothetical protein
LNLGLSGFLDLHRLAGAGVPASRSLAPRAGERAEADETDFIAPLQRAADRIEHPFDGLGRIAPAEAGRFRDRADELLFVHAACTPVTMESRLMPNVHLKARASAESKGKREFRRKFALSHCTHGCLELNSVAA